MTMPKRYQATYKESGLKLVAFLRKMLGEAYASRLIKKGIERNLCRINGVVERFASHPVTTGDKVEFDIAGLDRIASGEKVQTEKSRILYEDDLLLAYDKPAGLASEDKGLGGLFPEYFLVHRLDVETTGVILFAKTKTIKNAFVSQFKNFEVKKNYFALVDGVPEEKSGIIKNFLGKISEEDDEPRWGSVGSKRGKIAKTTWTCLKRGKHAALLECIPLTGRTHQIRVHLKDLGHPILGDFRYAKKFRCHVRVKRVMLHAASIEFIHPATGKKVRVSSALPEDFQQAMKKAIF